MKKNRCLSLSILLSITILTGCSNEKLNENTNNEGNKPTEIQEVNKEKDNSEKEQKENELEEYKNEPIITTGSIPLNVSFNILKNGKKLNGFNSDIMFSEKYSDVEGVLTFRGNNFRSSSSFGTCSVKENSLKPTWSFTTSSSSWGGGAGWTGQPAIIKWPKDIRETMNIKDKFKYKDNFTEVIYASLDGNIYFLDLETGEQTRNPIKIGNPIKGSLSIDPRGIPLLYVGEGIPEKGTIGYNIFSLIDGKKLHYINGIDNEAFRGWGAFDSSALILKDKDTLIEPGENGILYIIKLNTNFDKTNKTISINPETTKYRYKVKGNENQGLESSIAAYKNYVYIADNGGSIQCIDLQKLMPVWTFDGKDDTDATLVLDIEAGVPYLYTGCEVDKQGSKGFSYIKKINGLTGALVWENKYECLSVLGDHPVNGGLLATPVIGKNDIKDIVVFSLARYKNLNTGLTVALDKNTGKEVWKKDLPNYVWSSPVDFYTEEGKTYIIQCDSIGNMYFVRGKDGAELNMINLGSNIEATPAIFNDTLVVATRGGKIVAVKIK